MGLLLTSYLHLRKQIDYNNTTKEVRKKIDNIELLFEARKTIVDNSFNFYSDKKLYNQVTEIIEMYDQTIKNYMKEIM